MTVVVPLSAFLITISVLDLGSLSAIRSPKISKKEREIREFEMDLKNFFCLRSNLRDDDIISAYRSGLKTGMDLVWSGLKTGFLRHRPHVSGNL